MSENSTQELKKTPALLTAAARKAAVRLSGVAAIDRNWVLARLPIDQRKNISEAFQQLERIRGNTALDFDLFFEPDGQCKNEISGFSVNRVNELPFAEVKAVLDQLPLAYVAAIVGSGRWLESELYLKTCQKRRRNEIAAENVSNVSDATADAMLDAIALTAEAEMV